MVRWTTSTNPNSKLNYAATIDLNQAGDIARVRELHGGGANLTGSGTFAADNFSSSGKVSLRDVDFRQEGFAVRNASAGAEFVVDPERIVLKKIDARFLRGTLTGNAEVKHYAPSLEPVGAQLSAEKPSKASKPSSSVAANAEGRIGAAPVQQGSASLKLAGASLGELVACCRARAFRWRS